MATGIRHAVPLFLEDDTIGHIDWISEQLARQRNASVSRSEAVAWLAKRHWKKMMRQKAVAMPVARQPAIR